MRRIPASINTQNNLCPAASTHSHSPLGTIGPFRTDSEKKERERGSHRRRSTAHVRNGGRHQHHIFIYPSTGMAIIIKTEEVPKPNLKTTGLRLRDDDGSYDEGGGICLWEYDVEIFQKPLIKHCTMMYIRDCHTHIYHNSTPINWNVICERKNGLSITTFFLPSKDYFVIIAQNGMALLI